MASTSYAGPTTTLSVEIEPDPVTTDEPASSFRSDLIADFFRRNELFNPKISPDGRLLFLFQLRDGKRELIVRDPIYSAAIKLLSEQDREGLTPAVVLNEAHWVDNNHIAINYQLGDTARIVIVELERTAENGLGDEVKAQAYGENWTVYDSLPTVEDRAIVLVLRDNLPFLYNVNVNDPEKSIFGTSDFKFQDKINKTSYWLTDASGRLRVAIGLDDKKNEKIIWYRRSVSNAWKVAWRGNVDTVMVPVLVGDDDKTLTVISNEETEYAVLTTYDRKSKQYGSVLFSAPDSDIKSAVLDPGKTRVLAVTSVENGTYTRHYLGEDTPNYSEFLRAEEFDGEPYVIDSSTTGSRVLVRTSNSDAPGAYFILDSQEKTSYKIGELRPWLKQYRLGQTKRLETVSSDDLQIESFLTLPDPTAYPKPPLIVMPHGGPISVQDTRHFDSTAQLLASLGYAVLRTNYRGSSGSGKSFESKGNREWGRKIEDDIEASLRDVLDLGAVDEDRICIFGASYGGYSALISAIQRPQHFKCAASFAGVTDMNLLFHSFRASRSKVIRSAVERIVGNPDAELETLIEYSPVYNVKDLDLPVFIAHGDQDEIVDLEHFLRMKKMLEFYEKNAQYLVLEGEGHGFAYVASAIRFYSRLDDFFRETLDLPDVSATKVLVTK